jgi:hypothetical protein
MQGLVTTTLQDLGGMQLTGISECHTTAHKAVQSNTPGNTPTPLADD